METLISPSEAATRRLGALLGACCGPGQLILLEGELGAGKTTFTKGLGEGLGIEPSHIHSPTYVLMHVHKGRHPLHHLDAYRLSDGSELDALDPALVFSEAAVVVVEWPLHCAGALAADRLEIRLEHVSEQSRRLLVSASGEAHQRLLERWRESW